MFKVGDLVTIDYKACYKVYCKIFSISEKRVYSLIQEFIIANDNKPFFKVDEISADGSIKIKTVSPDKPICYWRLNQKALLSYQENLFYNLKYHL